MAAVRVYKSTDASAPSLNGNAGSLITVLDAVLVNGYGAQPAAGWSKAFSASNQATYRPGSGVKHFFHVDDNSPNVTAAGKEAQFRGSETATAFQTGTGFFPTTAQIALGSGLMIRKSASADGTARAWTIVADDRTCYIFVLTTDTANVYLGAMFGEFYSLLATGADAYRSIVIGRVTANSGVNSNTIEMLPTLVPASPNALAGHYVARNYSGTGTSAAARKWGDTARAGQTSTYNMGGAGLTLPEPVTGTIHVSPIHISEITSDVRGRLRGLFQVCHNVTGTAPNGIADGSTVAGTGMYAGRTFYVVQSVGSFAYFLDMTGPWETN